MSNSIRDFRIRYAFKLLGEVIASGDLTSEMAKDEIREMRREDWWRKIQRLNTRVVSSDIYVLAYVWKNGEIRYVRRDYGKFFLVGDVALASQYRNRNKCYHRYHEMKKTKDIAPENFPSIVAYRIGMLNIGNADAFDFPDRFVTIATYGNGNRDLSYNRYHGHWVNGVNYAQDSRSLEQYLKARAHCTPVVE